MKVLFLDEDLIFTAIPSDYPTQSDNLTLTLRNEQTDVVINPEITFTSSARLIIRITEQPTDFKIQNKYEVIIYNGENDIYRGKMIILDASTDVQNYKYSSQENERFGFK